MSTGSDAQRLRPLVLYIESAVLYSSLASRPGTSVRSRRFDHRLARRVKRARRRMERREPATRRGWSYDDWCAARRLVRDAHLARELTARPEGTRGGR